MTLRTFFRNLLRPDARVESHAIDKMALWGVGADDIGEPLHAGVTVTQENALRLTTVYRCISLITGTTASLPADALRKRDGIREEVPRPPRWLEQPNPETNWFEFIERIGESNLMDGNAFLLITARDSLGYPVELWNLHPREVDVRRDRPRGAVSFMWGGDQRLTKFTPMTPMGDVLHIRLSGAGGLRGMSPLGQARQAIGLGLVAEKFGSRFFGSGQQLSGVIQLPAAEPTRSKEFIDLMRETWEATHGGSGMSQRPGILTGGAEWKPLSITNEDAQFLETRKFQVEEICRLYGVPPHMVASVDKSTSWGTGIEEQSHGFVRFTLMAHLVRLETALSQLLPRGQYLRFNQRALLRATAQVEAETLVKYVTNGIYNPNRALELLDEPPRPGGDRYMVPQNMALLSPGGVPEPVNEGGDDEEAAS